MRNKCDWFSNRAQAIWKAKPGRSMLLIVPQGCDETSAASLVSKWTQSNFPLPREYLDCNPVCIRLSSDSFESSRHFSMTVIRAIEKKLKIQIPFQQDDYPSDLIQHAIEAALELKAYPILILERFHAFAMISEPGIGSVFARMRTLEHDSQLTTLALSPVGYDAIRSEMRAEQPFLNSVYGDNHDLAVMPPLTREEFLSAALEKGISEKTANRIYSFGGGPDAIYGALIDIALDSVDEIIERCIQRTGTIIDRFLERSFSNAGHERQAMLSALAVGKLQATQEAFLAENPCFEFIAKRKENGQIVCSSQILAIRILRGGEPTWSRYYNCITALKSGDISLTIKIIDSLSDSSTRLATFRDIIKLFIATIAIPDRGLLGIDWQATKKLTKSLKGCRESYIQPFNKWISRMDLWENLVSSCSSVRGDRLSLERLTHRAKEKEIRLLLLYMIIKFLQSLNSQISASTKVKLLVNLPESILQALSIGFCNIDFTAPPKDFPTADYNSFFGQDSKFELPTPSQKITLTSLLVIVPAILHHTKIEGSNILTNRNYIIPLQQKFVDQVRNPASHTITEFKEKDASFLQDLCNNLVNCWLTMEGFQSMMEIPGIVDFPGLDAVENLLYE